jgi:hypothetical protein
VFDEWPRRFIATVLTESTPRVVRVCGQDTQVFRVPAEDLHPDMAVPTLSRGVVNISDRQRVHIDQSRRFHGLKREICAFAIMVARLITLEASSVDSCLTTPASLLRALAEQAA